MLTYCTYFVSVNNFFFGIGKKMENTCYNYFMKISNSFGKNLREIRTKKGFTQENLAEISGVSRRMIGHYETQAKCPSLEKVEKIAKALNISIEELMEGLSTPNKKNVKEEEVSKRILKKVRVIEKLPTRDQNAIFQYIKTVVEKNKLREKLKKTQT